MLLALKCYIFVHFRRPRKPATRSPLEDAAANLKSSSELNLNTASTSVPIRTTRTSRLRAAAANSSESCQLSKRSNRSSSVQNLLEDEKNKTPKSTKIIDRDKTRTSSNRRQSHEKENLKSASTTCFPEKDNGAIRSKLKHSTNKNILEKDKSNLVVSPKRKNVDEKNSSKVDEKTSTVSVTEETEVASNSNDEKNIDVDDILNDILGDKSNSSGSERDRFDVLYNDVIVENKTVEIKVNDVSVLDNDSPKDRGLKISHKSSYIPVKEAVSKTDDVVKVERSVVPKNVKTEVGLLSAVCVHKVERFSELLSNLCSPSEADILFEDILVENGIDDVNSPVSKP